MSTLMKCLNLAKNVTTVCYNATSKTLQLMQQKPPQQLLSNQNQYAAMLGPLSTQLIHTSSRRHDLMEFFDDPKNWNENEVKVGRAWKLDELRIKSNKELHQLWYILLKERNMLKTMEHECNDKMELFPSPERVDKVKISMDNLETVVRERNKAYYELETGVTGERPRRLVHNPLGLPYIYKSCEHALPPFMNSKWVNSRQIGYGGRAVKKFLLLYREKLYNAKRKAKNRSRNEVMMLLRRNPNLDMQALRNKYPGVDVNKLINQDKTRGHYVPKIGV